MGEYECKKKKELDLKIRFDKSENTLYELGFISLDILQLVIFGELIEDDRRDELYKIFIEKKPYGYFTRNSKLYSEYSKNTLIKELEKGSIEIVISGLSATATVFNLIVYLNVNRQSKKDETIVFEINSNDDELNKLLDDFNNNYYGKGDSGFNWLIKNLSVRGYSTKLLTKDAYVIEKVSEDYGKRIIKVLNKQ